MCVWLQRYVQRLRWHPDSCGGPARFGTSPVGWTYAVAAHVRFLTGKRACVNTGSNVIISSRDASVAKGPMTPVRSATSEPGTSSVRHEHASMTTEATAYEETADGRGAAKAGINDEREASEDGIEELHDHADDAPTLHELAQTATDELLVAVARWRRRYPNASIEEMQDTLGAVSTQTSTPTRSHKHGAARPCHLSAQHEPGWSHHRGWRRSAASPRPP